MCGADEATFERARPVIEAFGKKIVLCGPVGAGDAVKAVNQALLGIHIWALSEGLVALSKAGISPRARARRDQRLERPVERLAEPVHGARDHARVPADVQARAAGERRDDCRRVRAREPRAVAAHADRRPTCCASPGGALGEEADHVETVKLLEEWAGVRGARMTTANVRRDFPALERKYEGLPGRVLRRAGRHAGAATGRRGDERLPVPP